MPAKRKSPYPGFNFQVELGVNNIDPTTVDGGFQEVTGLGMEVTISEYRNGNELENSVRKITGLNKVTDVTCKRGVIASDSLYKWLHLVRSGDQSVLDSRALPTVKIHLQDEAHNVVQTWKLIRAKAIKWNTPSLNAKGTDVAMEELVIAYERLELEL